MKDTVVACSICSGSVLLTHKSYGEILRSISRGSLDSILFRTTICLKCENKILSTESLSLTIPSRGNKIPVGTSMVMEWPVYKRVSLYMRKYCKLYECDGTFVHAVENKDDILSNIDGNYNMYNFQYDSSTYLESNCTYEFLLLNSNQTSKRRRMS